MRTPSIDTRTHGFALTHTRPCFGVGAIEGDGDAVARPEEVGLGSAAVFAGVGDAFHPIPVGVTNQPTIAASTMPPTASTNTPTPPEILRIACFAGRIVVGASGADVRGSIGKSASIRVPPSELFSG